MISNLTFKQENSITDEPVVDLLKYLNDTLDNAVTKARLPSGYNPLQQLVLVIADGRFHEKVNNFSWLLFLNMNQTRRTCLGTIYRAVIKTKSQ